jgi:hypothetical protein
MTVEHNVDGLRQNAQKKRQEVLDKVEHGMGNYSKLISVIRSFSATTLS